MNQKNYDIFFKKLNDKVEKQSVSEFLVME